MASWTTHLRRTSEENRSVPEEMAAHRVVQNLPAQIQAVIAAFGSLEQAASGAAVEVNQTVLFVLSGVLGAAIEPDAAVAIHVPGGGVWGLDQVFSNVPPLAVRAVIDSRWIAVPASKLADDGGADFWTRMYAHQAVGRLAAVSREVNCAARHSITSRAAKWLNRLTPSQGARVFTINQSDLAGVLAVQRTSINEAVAVMKKAGALRCRRGTIEVLDIQRLRSLACSCANREGRRPTFGDDGYVVLAPSADARLRPAHATGAIDYAGIRDPVMAQ